MNEEMRPIESAPSFQSPQVSGPSQPPPMRSAPPPGPMAPPQGGMGMPGDSSLFSREMSGGGPMQAQGNPAINSFRNTWGSYTGQGQPQGGFAAAAGPGGTAAAAGPNAFASSGPNGAFAAAGPNATPNNKPNTTPNNTPNTKPNNNQQQMQQQMQQMMQQMMQMMTQMMTQMMQMMQQQMGGKPGGTNGANPAVNGINGQGGGVNGTNPMGQQGGNVFNSWGQGREGNCVAVSTIKAAQDKYGNNIFKNVERTGNGYNITMQDGKKVQLSNEEYAQAERMSNFKGSGAEKDNATLCYAAMAKRAQGENYEGSRNSYARALHALNNGEQNPMASARFLGLGNKMKKVDPSALNSGAGGIGLSATHSVYTRGGTVDHYGSAYNFNGTDTNGRRLTEAYMFV
ncbi:MAG: hypothetical protein RDV48_10820 [Candidatus Eremiobacteraeota bacterium]|nr:hypothetical protein [Candidatus Eremiobacteraeota bacterium]